MRVNRISHIPYSHRVGRYHFQMVQAKLTAPVDPIISYSLQPFYTREQQWMTELSDSLSRLYRYSADLDRAARQFDPERPSSAVSKRLAISSDPETATAQAQAHAKIGVYRLDVASLANAQANKGKMAEAASPTSVAEGQQQFFVVTENQEDSYTFYSAATDTHGQSIQRMAEALGSQGSLLSTRIKSQGDQQALILERKATGKENAFAIQDQKGNSVRALGVQQVSVPARDAVFFLDGAKRSSANNQILIGNGEVRVSMHQKGAGPLSITVVPDHEGLLQHTRILVDRFNRLHAFLQEKKNTLIHERLETFERISRAADSSLNRYGIRLQSDGQMELREEVFQEEVAQYHDQFVQDMHGLAQQFREEAIRVQTKPLGAFSRPFEDAASRQPYASLSTSSFRYLHVVNTGLFINLLF
ncbi:hypothetical protein P9761_13740 [Brevibacillus centrosporus]|uniref:flagellar cap protein FliD N-terminal domain-containing protein n=1 Tax=Brevibacillus centrosporus TaxID=54910 RepID=UPI002E1F516D|nr:flagellar cap protein FliD N-terminal domain-containing protein [Brevibacillus centrosporus]MED4909250.1 hypothetical protein [Brevibacillus centrosporus]